LAVAVAIVVGLAVGVWWLWPRDDAGSPSTTLPLAATTIEGVTTTSSSPTSTIETGHVVETAEEAEEVLRELWFGWFEGIYNQDADRIREVVATEEQVETAREQFGVMEFTGPPTGEGLTLAETEILRSDEQCLAVWASVTSDFRPGSTASVHVIRWASDRWVAMSYWPLREDLWEADCEALLSSSS
jgi:hypothetical protein